jgi:NADP-reducing hydrogenase subunit HndB
MPRVTSLDELHKLRAQLRDGVTQRYDVGTTLVVGMGTCGIAAGARETLLALNDELATREIAANVTIDGCIGKCQFEPLVTIHRSDAAPVMYGHVTADRVPELVDKLAQGQVIQEWVVPSPEELARTKGEA